MAVLRLSFRVAWIVGLFLLCVPVHSLWRILGLSSPWPRRFLGWVSRAAGMRVEVEGEPLRRDVLFVANHESWLDILLLGGASGTAFVAKAEVATYPLIGRLAGLNNTVFVARSERRSVRGQADQLREALASGQPVALFPEGTTDGGRDVLPFRASLLASLFPPLPGVRLQPVALDYGAGARDIAWVGDEAGLDNVKRVLSRPGTLRVRIRFLPPIDPAEAADRKRLAEASRARIVAALAASGRAALPL
ncbi:MAG TPA: 1-acyl-sn-glycerol-3-phosphate acyltransferase [Allosphingosinicella sp.]|nr:1-acyl-sn-glycerol-3-phosphate acyltransferase [Allosphingosinicella sp.]